MISANNDTHSSNTNIINTRITIENLGALANNNSDGNTSSYNKIKPSSSTVAPENDKNNNSLNDVSIPNTSIDKNTKNNLSNNSNSENSSKSGFTTFGSNIGNNKIKSLSNRKIKNINTNNDNNNYSHSSNSIVKCEQTVNQSLNDTTINETDSIKSAPPAITQDKLVITKNSLESKNLDISTMTTTANGKLNSDSLKDSKPPNPKSKKPLDPSVTAKDENKLDTVMLDGVTATNPKASSKNLPEKFFMRANTDNSITIGAKTGSEILKHQKEILRDSVEKEFFSDDNATKNSKFQKVMSLNQANTDDSPTADYMTPVTKPDLFTQYEMLKNANNYYHYRENTLKERMESNKHYVNQITTDIVSFNMGQRPNPKNIITNSNVGVISGNSSNTKKLSQNSFNTSNFDGMNNKSGNSMINGLQLFNEINNDKVLKDYISNNLEQQVNGFNNESPLVNINNVAKPNKRNKLDHHQPLTQKTKFLLKKSAGAGVNKKNVISVGDNETYPMNGGQRQWSKAINSSNKLPVNNYYSNSNNNFDGGENENFQPNFGLAASKTNKKNILKPLGDLEEKNYDIETYDNGVIESGSNKNTINKNGFNGSFYAKN